MECITFENIEKFKEDLISCPVQELEDVINWAYGRRYFGNYNEIVSNIDEHKAILDIINKCQNDVKAYLLDMNRLAILASDHAYTHEDRKHYQLEYNNNVERINNIYKMTKYCGVNLWNISKVNLKDMGDKTLRYTSDNATKEWLTRSGYKLEKYTYYTKDITCIDLEASKKSSPTGEDCNIYWGESLGCEINQSLVQSLGFEVINTLVDGADFSSNDNDFINVRNACPLMEYIMALINIVDCQILTTTTDFKNLSSIKDKILNQHEIASKTLKTKISDVQKVLENKIRNIKKKLEYLSQYN